MSGRGWRLFQYFLLAATAALVVLFFFQTRLQDVDIHNTHAQDILHLKQYDTLLEDEMLKTVTLQLTQYDPIVDTVAHIRALQDQLSQDEIGEPGDDAFDIAGQLDAYGVMMNKKIDLVETIKSRTAIVRNTLNFLQFEVGRLTKDSHDFLDMQLNRLLGSVLAHNINPTPHNLKELESLLNTIEGVQTAGIPPQGLDRVLHHARANIEANDDITQLMQSFMSLASRDILDQAYTSHSAFLLKQIKTANAYRNVLLALSMILFIGLAIVLHRMHKAHDHLQRTSRQFKDAVESISEGFAFFDNDRKLQFWNKTFANLHAPCAPTLVKGMAYTEFYDMCVEHGLYTEDAANNANNFGASVEFETSMGTWLLASNSPMSDGGIACVRIDISENKRAEAQMRNLSRAVEQSPASVIITDLNGIIDYVNPKFTETTGYTADEAIGNRPSLVSSGERPQSEYKDMWDTISAGNEWRGEFHNKRKDGSLFWEFASISPIKSKTGKITSFLAVKEDITERKETMAALVRAKEQAELASHAKTQFLANMSHELRTPLNAIIGFSEIIKGQMFGPLGNEQYLDYTANIHESGVHLLEVINDILDISRIETGAMEIREGHVDLAKLAKSCLDMVHDRATKEKLTLKCEVTDGAGHVYGDEMRLKQVMINLLSNAVKFTPEGGAVRLIVDLNSTGETIITVTDTGYGIPQDKLDVVLEPFGQVSDIYSRNHEGSGLGLYLVNAFVKLHGGHIKIDSELEHGTTVTVTLPKERTRSADTPNLT